MDKHFGPLMLFAGGGAASSAGGQVSLHSGLKPRSDPLTDEQKQVCKRMGISEEKFAANLAPKKDLASELGLSAEEMAVCRKMNVDPSKFAEQKTARRNPTDYAQRV